MHYLLGYCREGFERDLLEELTLALTRLGGTPTPVHKKLKGVVIIKDGTADPAKICASVTPHHLIFARQVIHTAGAIIPFDGADRAGPLADALMEQADALIPERLYSDIFIETPDTNEGKKLSPFCRKFVPPFTSRLTRAGFKRVYTKAHAPRIHALFLDYDSGLVGVSYPVSASPHPQGIVRLKFPSAAPSRSTLKLEEAFHELLSDEERLAFIGEGMVAVDLGAAPGGWTYQLVRRGMRVTAVDNGALDPVLKASPLVTHLREDAYKYLPLSPVDWLVCDMVDRPGLVADLIAHWFARRLCRSAVVNLKLPMKNRVQTVHNLLQTLRQKAAGGLDGYRIAVRQLYHDRDEVTLVLVKSIVKDAG